MIVTYSFEPEGFRDVYWCYNLNEPVIVSYKDDCAYCVNCNMLSATGTPDDSFLRSHSFMMHLHKPQGNV